MNAGASTPSTVRPAHSGDASRADLAREVWRLLVRIPIDHHEHFARVAAADDLSMAQAHALLELDPDRPVPMSVLAQCLRNDPSNVTGLVDRLEAKGLVERRPHPTDRRVKALALTETGARVRARLQTQLYKPPAALAHLAPAELRLLLDVLQRLAAAAAP